MYHCLVLNINHHVVLNTAKMYPLVLSAKFIKQSGCASAFSLVFGEVREVLAQENFKNSKKRNR